MDKGRTLTARLLEKLADSIIDIGESYTGVCNSGMAASTTTIVCDDLKDFDDDYFNDGWLMYIAHNDDAPGTAPEGEARDISDYVSTTGTFTTAAFSANVEESDVVIVARVTTFIIDQVKLMVSPVDGSLASFISSGNGSTTLGTRIGVDASIIDALGHNGVTRLDSGLDSILTDGLLNGTGTVLPSNKSIYNILGTGYIHDDGNFTHSIRKHLRLGLAGGTATNVLADDKSILDAIGHNGVTTLNSGIYGNIGDFAGQTHLQTLLAALGIPDVSGKSFYTCLITDRLDDGTFGLAALDTELGLVKSKTDLMNSALGTGTLNDENTSDTIVPGLLPTSMHITLDINNLNNNGDDFDIEVKVGVAASECIVAFYNLTSDGTDITVDKGSGTGAIIKQRRIDISDILVYTGEQVIVELTKNNVTDRDVLYNYICGV